MIKKTVRFLGKEISIIAGLNTYSLLLRGSGIDFINICKGFSKCEEHFEKDSLYLYILYIYNRKCMRLLHESSAFRGRSFSSSDVITEITIIRRPCASNIMPNRTILIISLNVIYVCMCELDAHARVHV